MRYHEIFEAILQGSSIGSWVGYLEKMLTVPTLAIGETGEKARGLRLTPASQKIIQNLINEFKRTGLNRNFIKTIENTEITFTNNTTAFIKQIYKSPELKSVVSVAGSNVGVKKYWNDGAVAETFLGAALYTRFLQQTDVTKDKVLEVMKDTKKFKIAQDGFFGKGRRKTNPVNMFSINTDLSNQFVREYLSSKEKLEKQFPEALKNIDRMIDGCVAYVNQSLKVKDALKEADKHPNSKEIQIKTDGITDQKGTKADLEIRVGKTLRLLSLKANDVKQFGQTSGSTGTIISNFFKTFIPNVNISRLYEGPGGKPKNWDPDTGKGWPDMSKSGKAELQETGLLEDAITQVYKLTGEAYKIAYKDLKSNLEEDPNTVIANLYRGIVFHAQSGQEGQTLVILNPDSKTAWKELEFGPNLIKAIKSFNIHVVLQLGNLEEKSNHILKIYGTPKDGKAALSMVNDISSTKVIALAKTKAKSIGSKAIKGVGPELLFQLRSYLQNREVQRNIVEMGPLLKSITEVQKINDSGKVKNK